MSEYIDNNSRYLREHLKNLILHLHNGETPEMVKQKLEEELKSIPYNIVAEVEQELIESGLLAVDEVQELCDIHHKVMEDSIEAPETLPVPEGHPVHTFMEENYALRKECNEVLQLLPTLPSLSGEALKTKLLEIRGHLNLLWDVDKHYKRKEYLLFPYMEQKGITGPPTVMWGKHDETRAVLKEIDALFATLIEGKGSDVELMQFIERVNIAMEQIDGMTRKEQQILLPWCLELLAENEWRKIYHESAEFGFCIIDPRPWIEKGADGAKASEVSYSDTAGPIRLNTGTFDTEELEALFLHLPIDITFVDKDDKVRFYSHSAKRVFERNRSILGRDVRMCHPPASVHVVEEIVNDFKSGKHNKARFWISNFRGHFIYIEYTAVRSPEGKYLGVVECTQDITELRALEGDRRLLQYDTEATE